MYIRTQPNLLREFCAIYNLYDVDCLDIIYTLQNNKICPKIAYPKSRFCSNKRLLFVLDVGKPIIFVLSVTAVLLVVLDKISKNEHQGW